MGLTYLFTEEDIGGVHVDIDWNTVDHEGLDVLLWGELHHRHWLASSDFLNLSFGLFGLLVIHLWQVHWLRDGVFAHPLVLLNVITSHSLLLGKGYGDWGGLISHKILEVSSGDIGIHKLEKAIGIRLLGKSNGNWCWLVSDEVLKVSSGDVGIHKFEEAIGIGLLRVELDKGLGDWGIGVLDEVNESRLGHVLTVKLSNLDLSLMVLL